MRKTEIEAERLKLLAEDITNKKAFMEKMVENDCKKVELLEKLVDIVNQK